MSRVVLSALCLVLSAGMAFSRTVKTETVVANPGVTVSVPVSVDAIDGAASAVVTIGYDSTVLVCLGADAGELAFAGDMTYLDSGAGRLCAVFSAHEVRLAEAYPAFGNEDGDGKGAGSGHAGLRPLRRDRHAR